ncbi:hypothetical protein M1146_04725 [Patescibacteria group bacterium]|nr:hypothetical protein [Patescibacteria group bacterium]
MISGGNDSSLFVYSLVLDSDKPKKKPQQQTPPANQQTKNKGGRGRGRGRATGGREEKTNIEPETKEVETQQEKSKVIAKIGHKSKINWLETSQNNLLGNLFVADQTEIITSYSFT